VIICDKKIENKYSNVKYFYDNIGKCVKVCEIGITGTENPRVGSSILSLGTSKSGVYGASCCPCFSFCYQKLKN
jgi:hypothetical protein